MTGLHFDFIHYIETFLLATFPCDISSDTPLVCRSHMAIDTGL